MKPAQIEELQYFYLKYVHTMNEIKSLLRDAISLKRHIDCLESENIPECDILGLNPEKARADIMRKVGQETTKRKFYRGVICG